MTMPRTILHMIDNLHMRGGALTVVRDILSEMKSMDTRRHVLCCLQSAHPGVIYDFENAGIDVVVLNHHKYDPFLLRSVCKVSAEYCATAIHAHLAGSIIMGGYAKIRKAVPFLICHLHSQPSNWLRGQLERLGLRHADWLIPVSETNRKRVAEAHEIDIDPHNVIHNGIRLSGFRNGNRAQARQTMGVSDEDAVIGFVGRLHPVKNVDVLIRAIRLVHSADECVRLVIVGDGPLAPRLHKQVTDDGADPIVKFLGMRNDVAALLPGIDVFALPSRWESLPLAPLEAMACRLPVVGTHVGGLPEVVVDGETGLLVPPNDSEALAKAILQLVSDPEMRRAMGAAGRCRVQEHFTIQNTARRIKEVYDTVFARTDG